MEKQMTLSLKIIIICFIIFTIKLGYMIKNTKFTKKTFVYSIWCLLAMSPPIIRFLINDSLLEYSYEKKQREFAIFNLINLIVISSFCFVVLYKIIKSIDNHFTIISVLGIILLSIFSTLSIKANEYSLVFGIIPMII